MVKKVIRCVLSIMLVTACLSSCGDMMKEKSPKEVRDSINFAEKLKDIYDPSLTSVEDLENFHKDLKYEEWVKETFTKMSPEMINRVGKVVLANKGSVDMEALVEEYRQHYDIYIKQQESWENNPKLSDKDLINLSEDTIVSVSITQKGETK